MASGKRIQYRYLSRISWSFKLEFSSYLIKITENWNSILAQNLDKLQYVLDPTDSLSCSKNSTV
jgi:hypothetical protein